MFTFCRNNLQELKYNGILFIKISAIHLHSSFLTLERSYLYITSHSYAKIRLRWGRIITPMTFYKHTTPLGVVNINGFNVRLHFAPIILRKLKCNGILLIKILTIRSFTFIIFDLGEVVYL